MLFWEYGMSQSETGRILLLVTDVCSAWIKMASRWCLWPSWRLTPLPATAFWFSAALVRSCEVLSMHCQSNSRASVDRLGEEKQGMANPISRQFATVYVHQKCVVPEVEHGIVKYWYTCSLLFIHNSNTICPIYHWFITTPISMGPCYKKINNAEKVFCGPIGPPINWK